MSKNILEETPTKPNFHLPLALNCAQAVFLSKVYTGH